MLMSVREGQEEIIIGGDFNFDWKKRNICKPVKRFGNLMSESSLTQVIKENTRITEYSRTQIDLIFTSRPELYVSGVLHVGFSDHSAVFAVRKLHRMKPPPPRSIETRNYKRYDKDAFVQDLNNVPWPLVSRSSCDDVDSSWDTFKILFNDVANSHAPTMKVRLRSREIPWVTPDIRQLMVERNVIHKKAIKTNKELYWSEFKRLRNLVTLKLRKAKQRYYSNHLKENEGNQKETWKSLKDLLGNSKKSDSVTTNLISEEKRVKSSNFNHFFVNVARNLTSAYASAGQCFRRWLRPTNHSEKFTIRDITVAETRKALKELKPRKATGLDGIRLLKDAANVLAGPLTEIFNMTVGQGKIPKEWKKAKVIPVHKSGPRDDPGNHRPISILPVVSKVLERLIHGQLSAYLKRMNFLCENQSGFRRNSFHPALKFTWEISETSVTFLDINISVQDNKLATSVHYKPTDSHSYLLYSSSHPSYVKDSIPYSQFLRLRRLCSEDSDFNSKCDEMSNFFSERGYPDSILSKALNRVQNVNRESALEPSASDNEERIPFTLTFHPNNLAARNVVLRNFKILQSDPETAPIFPNPPLVSFKRDRNLRNSLVRSSLPSNLEPGTFNCSRKVCNTCPFINSKTHIRGPNGSYQVNDHFDCTTSNIIYCITCTLCNKLYIGESGRKLGDRFREHLLDVKNKGSDLSKPVARHFNLPGHSHEHMEICGIYLHLGNNETRKRKEQRLIFKLGTLAPNGINERFSFA